MRGNGIFNTVTQICATKACCKLFLTRQFICRKAVQQVAFAVLLRFHDTFFICRKRQLYFIWYLFVVSRHAFLSVQNHIYFIGFLSFYGTIFFFSKLQLYFILYWFVVSRHGVFVCSKICAVQNNVEYNEYSLLMMNCQIKCNTQKKVVE